MLLGANVALIDRYLSAYRWIVILITAAAVLGLLVRWAVKKRERADGERRGKS